MGKQDEDKKTLSVNLPARANYEVGYGKPPKATRFQPGQSGNPRGRPRGAKNRKPRLNEERLKSIILEEAYRTIKVRDGEKHVSVPIAQAVVRSLAVNAARGQHRAQQLFSQLLSATETANKRLHDEWLETAIEYKVDWERELERRQRLGIEAPDPIPHPDDIEIDMRTGEAVIKGPLTREEKAELDLFRERKTAFEQALAEHRQELIDNPDHEYRKFIEDDIAHTEKILTIIRRVIPD
jgi:hypothetical protein